MKKGKPAMEVMPKNLQINRRPIKKRLLIATPTLGIIRYEWAHHRYGQIIPMNWEASTYDLQYTVLGYSIDDAYNNIVKKFYDDNFEWLLLIEDDVLIPVDCFKKIGDYINHENVPIVSGLYYLKAEPTKPLVFRGRGNGAYINFEIGDRVWCDGLPFGCLLINGRVLRYMYENSETYQDVRGNVLKRVIQSPQRILIDPSTWGAHSHAGTQDLFFFDRILNENILAKTGWKKYARRKYPFLCDTSIFCRHIDLQTGRQYP
jgi:hypothetical protein